MRIIQITEEDKMELSELGEKVTMYMHEFLKCLDKTTGGEISEEMAKRYSQRSNFGERRGVPGTGRYARRDGGYNQRSSFGERRGVPGTGRYARRDNSYAEHYPEEYSEQYDERYDEGGYNTRYDY